MDRGCVWAGCMLLLRHVIAVSDVHADPAVSLGGAHSAMSPGMAPPSQENITCPWDYVLYPQGERCFKMRHVSGSWYTAREYCRGDGADLAVIPDRDTNVFIKAMTTTHHSYWIGLQEVFERTNRFKWVNGRDVTYSDFATDEPNNDSGEDCIELWTAHGWNDRPCRDTSFTICEKEPNGLTNIYNESSLSCPNEYVLYGQGETCLKLSNVKKTWNDSRKACEEDNGDLVVIPDMETLSFIKETESEGDTAITRYTLNDSMTDSNSCPESGSDSSSCSDVYPLLSSSMNLEHDLLPTTQTEPDLQPTTQTEPDLQPTTQTEPYSQSWTWVEPDPLTHTSQRAMCNGLMQTTRKYIIGLRYFQWRNTYRWIDGVTMSNPASSVGAPNDECVIIGGTHNEWFRFKCISANFYICEKVPFTTAVCPDGWTMYPEDQTCFKAYDDRLSWSRSRGVCQREGGDLAMLRDTKTFHFVADLVARIRVLWVGTIYRGNTFQWLDGTPIIPFSGMKMISGRNQLCGAISWEGDMYKYEYLPCAVDHIPYICRKDPVVTSLNTPTTHGTPTNTPTTNGTPTNTPTTNGTPTNTPTTNGTPTNTPTTNGTPTNTPTTNGTPTNTPTTNGTLTNTPTTNDTTTNTPTDPVTPNSTHTTVNVNVTEPVPGPELQSFALQGETYQQSSQPHQYSHIPDLCKRHNLTEYIIQSNEQFWWFHDIMSVAYALYGNFKFWIKTNKPLYWDLNYWGNNEFVDSNAWAIGVHSTTPCFKGHISDCCVVLTWDPVKNGTYLLDAPCTDTASGLCVEENNVTGITIVPLPTIELVMTVETVSLLKKLTAPKNGSVVKQLCPCRCRSDKIDFNPSPAALLSMLNKIQKELKVDTTQLASKRNKNVSAPDKRTSSQAIGYISLALCAVPLGLIIFCDILRLFHVQK